jgi:hypothetical protein
MECLYGKTEYMQTLELCVASLSRAANDRRRMEMQKKDDIRVGERLWDHEIETPAGAGWIGSLFLRYTIKYFKGK